MEENKKYKIGMMRVTKEMVFNKNFPVLLGEIAFVPLKVHMNYDGIFEYTGLSRIFEEIEKGQEVPQYLVCAEFKNTEHHEIIFTIETVSKAKEVQDEKSKRQDSDREVHH